MLSLNICSVVIQGTRSYKGKLQSHIDFCSRNLDGQLSASNVVNRVIPPVALGDNRLDI